MQDQQLERYSRHILLPEMDYDGQQKLLNASVVVLGLGGLGSSAAYYLAASGIGHITLVDDDSVEISNLQRQIVHNEHNLGMNKAESAAKTLSTLNSTIKIDIVSSRLPETDLADLFNRNDVVLDCCDNSASRMRHNRLCIMQGTPLASGAAVGLNGQFMFVDPKQDDSPCYACIYPEIDDSRFNCSESGILAPVVGMVGMMQALETIKYLSEIGKPNYGKLWTLNGFDSSWRTFQVRKNPQCNVCGSA
ncbi:molybdopterin-synthase adenylyltransferase MoeB [Bermanella marisrubri]|uniref:Molybdopterin biosynthesis protein MoeB n=1 Tax=Bermanella marisrubri TaxID=207949 RepID=Q1N137_9GAMM|nr:molybdopterin-synthase adenylyltransferase MoeB [Bermanella marisrubri]EAT12014.1 molybdopterin biosynthesis protein MoeB [Oceanobacter sp. RED65] [Bermanella marisrubri]QIZ84819.1 molybdopterin-synthase adenylyltransferase MoeB [Bermanella marisrubri]